VETREALADLSGYLHEAAGVAERIAGGDLTVDPRPPTDRDVLGNAFAKMAENLRSLVGSVADSAGTVSAASQRPPRPARSAATASRPPSRPPARSAAQQISAETTQIESAIGEVATAEQLPGLVARFTLTV
jgi:methyl-accepting chemotaxis protein